ncbi:putative aarF domain-containing protein kinase 2 [Mantella aurantiaca]
MSQALNLGAGLLSCSRVFWLKSPRNVSRWKEIAIRYQGNIFKYSRIKRLSKISLMCLGVKYVPTECERLYHRSVPAEVAMFSGASPDHHKSEDNLLKKTSFVIRLLVRSCVLLLKFGPLLLVYPLTYLSGRFYTLWLHLLLKATESSGPACIKLGQWASTRRDLFSETFCAQFSRLHVKVAPHSWGYTEFCLRRAFGDDYGQVLTFLNREPVGSGCVAQVYKAYVDLSVIDSMESKSLIGFSGSDYGFEAWEVAGLGGIFRHFGKAEPSDHNAMENQRSIDGTRDRQQEEDPNPSSIKRSEGDSHCMIPVAVKVLHPGLRQQVKVDLLLMKIWSRMLGLIPGFRWLSLTEIVEEFEKMMTRQINLKYEARNLEMFHQKFENVEFIKFPIPLRPFVTRNILVETFEEGEPLATYLQETESTQIKQRIASLGVNMLLKMVFVDNFVHADLHPGNILVQGTEEFTSRQAEQTTLVDMCDTLIVNVRPSRCPLRLVLLDAGIVAQLQERDLENFRSVFTAVVLGQGETVAELILHHARANQCTDVESFKSQMAELVHEARKSTVSLGKLHVALLLSQVFRLLMKHKVKLESNFASIVFAIVVLEGLGRSLDPEIDILEAARPLLVKTAASLM